MNLKSQVGFIPVVVLVALVVSTFLGGYLDFKLGDGTFFSAGIASVLVLAQIFSPLLM